MFQKLYFCRWDSVLSPGPLKSRVIGDIVEVNASLTTLTDESSNKLDSKHFGGSMCICSSI